MKLINTNVNGLCLTPDGKAWHKSAKRELTPTKSGKIRFNSKLYDLQKLIDFSQCKTTNRKPTVKKSDFINQLLTQGYKKTKISGLFITNNGKGYNVATKRSLSIVGGKIIIKSKEYNISKIILETFCNIPMRSGQTIFINGNENDFYFENLKYKSTIIEPVPNEKDLIKCIRCFFEAAENLNKRNPIIKFYVQQIINFQSFDLKHTGTDFDLFIEYFKSEYNPVSNNQKNVFEKFNYSNTNGKNAINKYLNL